jgi:predicted nucleic acid-binding protein
LIVADTSAILAVLSADPPDPKLRQRLADDGDLHVPHLLDVEFLHALRRLVASGALTEERATAVRADFADLTLTRYPHHPLADRMWELRHNLSAYDATFITLSEALDVPLVTCDARMAEAPGHRALVEVFPIR